MIGYLISNYFQYLKQDLRKTLYSEKDRDIEGLTSKAFNDGNVMRYYDQETYVLYRKFYEDTNIIEFEDVMSPISKKKIERREYNHFGQLHRKIYFSSRTYHKILEEYFDTEGSIYCKNSSIHKRQMN